MAQFAYAKVNIGLRVFKKDPSEPLHRIDSYMALIDLHDTLDLSFEKGSSIEINRYGTYSNYIDFVKDTDILERTYRLFRELTHLEFALRVDIKKEIPFCSGLGGASSDAALLLKELNRHFDSPLSKKELMGAAFSLGSDVPFFATGYPLGRVRGYGDDVIGSESDFRERNLYLLSEKKKSMKTERAYSILDERGGFSDKSLPDSLDKLNRDLFPNDFEALYGGEEEILESILHKGYFSLTGSGSYWFLVLDRGERLSEREVLLLEKAGIGVSESSFLECLPTS